MFLLVGFLTCSIGVYNPIPSFHPVMFTRFRCTKDRFLVIKDFNYFMINITSKINVKIIYIQINISIGRFLDFHIY